jgi:hypothetical protein
MRVLLYADGLVQEWSEMIAAQGHEAAVLPVGTPAPQERADMCLVATSDPVSARFWMSDLHTPMVLITSAVGPAQLLCGRVPSLRMICHPSRAVQALGDLLEMACDVRAGVVILEQHVEPVQRGHRWGAAYAVI